ncbi:MAG: hypothetical protein RR216_00010, partial [Pseudoflavonifractor sp.]
MVSDKSLGFTWAINSRENKLTPWHNDTRLDNRGEMIILNIDDNFYDLVLNSAVVLAPDSASWYGEAQGMQFEVNVTVPERGAVKLCRVKIKNNSAQKVQARLAYYCEPVLGPNSSLERFICADTSPKGIILTSSWSDLKGYCALDLMEGKADSSEQEILRVYSSLQKYFPSWVGYNMAKCGGCIRACVSRLEKEDC